MAIYSFAILSGLVQLSLPLGIQAIIGFSFGAQLVVSIYVLILLVILGVLIVGILNLNMIKLIEILQQKIFTKSALEISQKLIRIDLENNNKYYLPEKVNRYFEIFSIQKGLSKIMLDIPLASIQIIMGLIVLTFYDSSFILFGLLLILLLWLILKYTSSLGLRTAMEESNDKYNLASWLEDLARTLRTFKFSQNSNLALSRTDQIAANYLDNRNKHFQVLMIQYKALVGFKIVITAAMLGVGTYLLIEQAINIGEFIAAEIVILMVISATEKLIYHLDSLYDVAIGLSKLESIYEQNSEPSSEFIWKPTDERGPSFQLVHFSYKFYDTHNFILKNINLNIEANSLNIVCGSEGEGKTTLLKILGSIYQNYEGSVRMDELELNSFDRDSVRKYTGFYFRNQELFTGTIYENISLNKSTVTKEDVVALIKKFNFHSLIQGSTKGIDCPIEPLGAKLSTNMVKKILLLRTFVHQPRILLMDEPFIGLFENEKKMVFNYLEEIKHRTTIVIVSNDPEIQLKSDQIIYLENGIATIRK